MFQNVLIIIQKRNACRNVRNGASRCFAYNTQLLASFRTWDRERKNNCLACAYSTQSLPATSTPEQGAESSANGVFLARPPLMRE